VRYGSLFSGYGGLDRAVEEVFGAKAAWHSEIEPSAVKVLERHWPGVPNLGDVAEVDWADVEPVEIMCGGFPCTDLSAAGKQAGLNPKTRSGLWSHFGAAIGALRPELVVIENVRGLTSAPATHPAHELGFCPGCLGVEPERVVLRALGAVLGDLADLGFDAEWLGLPASSIGAPHPRFRIVVLAWPAADTAHVRHEWGRGPRRWWPGPADRGVPSASHAESAERRVEESNHLGPTGGSAAEPGERAGQTDRWEDYGPAIRRWELILSRPAPEPTIAGKNGQPKLSPSFVEWMMGLPDGWVTDVGVTANEALKMLGNGVVPQQVAAGLRLLLDRVEGEWNSRSA
jgi:DNA (cytosine-5)-methyltransferase 1